MLYAFKTGSDIVLDAALDNISLVSVQFLT